MAENIPETTSENKEETSALYKVKNTTILHNEKPSIPGATIKLTETEAKKLADYVTLIPGTETTVAINTADTTATADDTSGTANTTTKKSTTKTTKKTAVTADTNTTTTTDTTYSSETTEPTKTEDVAPDTTQEAPNDTTVQTSAN